MRDDKRTDRRKVPLFGLGVTVGGDTEPTAELTNVTQNGIAILSVYPVPVGQEVQLRIRSHSSNGPLVDIQVRGEVCFCREREDYGAFDIGLALVRPSPLAVKEIARMYYSLAA